MFLSDGVVYHMLMLQSISVIYILVIVLVERYFRPKSATLIGLFFAFMIFKFSVQANICYFQLDMAYQRSNLKAAEILTRIHLLDDGSAKRVAFIDGDEQSLITIRSRGVDDIIVHAHQIHPDLMYNQDYSICFLNNRLGYEFEAVDDIELQKLKDSNEVKAMSCYPARDSIKLIGDVIVVKYKEAGHNYGLS